MFYLNKPKKLNKNVYTFRGEIQSTDKQLKHSLYMCVYHMITLIPPLVQFSNKTFAI